MITTKLVNTRGIYADVSGPEIKSIIYDYRTENKGRNAMWGCQELQNLKRDRS